MTGSFAEYVTIATAVGLAPLPQSISFTDAAALGLAGTAAYAIIDAATLEPGHIVLVVGATGGVGNQVVQLATAASAVQLTSRRGRTNGRTTPARGLLATHHGTYHRPGTR